MIAYHYILSLANLEAYWQRNLLQKETLDAILKNEKENSTKKWVNTTSWIYQIGWAVTMSTTVIPTLSLLFGVIASSSGMFVVPLYFIPEMLHTKDIDSVQSALATSDRLYEIEKKTLNDLVANLDKEQACRVDALLEEGLKPLGGAERLLRNESQPEFSMPSWIYISRTKQKCADK